MSTVTDRRPRNLKKSNTSSRVKECDHSDLLYQLFPIVTFPFHWAELARRAWLREVTLEDLEGLESGAGCASRFIIATIVVVQIDVFCLTYR